MTYTEYLVELYRSAPDSAVFEDCAEHVTLFTLAGGLPVYGEPQALTQGGCREFHGWAE